jgi:deferrochelatase/peroxidase EfeB
MAPGRAPAEPVLDVDEIQGNILAGFNKDHQRLIAIVFRGIPAAKRWLLRVLPHINSTREVLGFNSLFKMARARRGGQEPTGLVATWMNIAFSHDGIAKLTSAAIADELPDPSFVAGLTKGQSQFLGDFAASPQDDPTADWVVGGTGRVPDVLMIVASDHVDQLVTLAAKTIPNEQIDGPDAPTVVWQELGETRTDLPGHEHFGFKDGVSQPGVFGLVSKRPKAVLTPRLLENPDPTTVAFAKPGQPLVWPGNFVLGYPSTNRNDGTPVDPAPLKQQWFRNGSFLVFRRLTQDVAGFHRFLQSTAADLSQTPGFTGLTPEHLGAQLVGRWPSGAPVSRVPHQDDPNLAADSLANNDFLFGSDTPAPDYLPGVKHAGAFPPAMEGSNGPICPHAAHIFKVNPRDLDSDVGPDFDTLTRRVFRRGIPFAVRLRRIRERMMA